MLVLYTLFDLSIPCLKGWFHLLLLLAPGSQPPASAGKRRQAAASKQASKQRQELYSFIRVLPSLKGLSCSVSSRTYILRGVLQRYPAAVCSSNLPSFVCRFSLHYLLIHRVNWCEYSLRAEHDPITETMICVHIIVQEYIMHNIFVLCLLCAWYVSAAASDLISSSASFCG